MADSSESVIRDLLVRLGVKFDKDDLETFNAGIAKAKAGMLGLAVAAGTVAAAVGGLVELAVETANVGREAERVANMFGMSTQSVQELQYAAQVTNVPVTVLQTSLGQLARHIAEAERGSKQARDSFSRMGLSFRDASGNVKSADQLLGELADKIAKMPAGLERAGMASELLGARTGVRLLPLLERGAAGIAELRKEAIALGDVFTDEQIKRSDEFAVASIRAQGALKGIGFAIGSAILPLLTPLLDRFTKWVILNRDWIASEAEYYAEQLGERLKSLADFLQEVNDAVESTIGWTDLLVGGLGILSVVVAGLAGVSLVALISGLIDLGIALSPVLVPMLLLGAAIVAAALAIDDFYVYMKGGDSVFGAFLKQNEKARQLFDTLKDAAVQAGTAIQTVFTDIIDTAQTVVNNPWVKELIGAFKFITGMSAAENAGKALATSAIQGFATGVPAQTLQDVFGGAADLFRTFNTQGAGAAALDLAGMEGRHAVDAAGAIGGAAASIFKQTPDISGSIQPVTITNHYTINHPDANVIVQQINDHNDSIFRDVSAKTAGAEPAP